MSIKCAVCGFEIDKDTWHYLDNTEGKNKHICSDECLENYLSTITPCCNYCGQSLGCNPIQDEDGYQYCCHECLALSHNIECGTFDDFYEDECDDDEEE